MIKNPLEVPPGSLENGCVSWRGGRAAREEIPRPRRCRARSHWCVPGDAGPAAARPEGGRAADETLRGLLPHRSPRSIQSARAGVSGRSQAGGAAPGIR